MIDTDSFAYEVSGEGKAELDSGHTVERINIVNEVIEEEVTPTPTATITPTHGNSYTQTPTPYVNRDGKTPDSPKTGDNTPIGLYLLLLIIAAGLAGGVVYKKKKQK